MSFYTKMEDLKKITVRLSEKEYNLIKKKAKSEKRSLNAYISYHLTEELRNHI